MFKTHKIINEVIIRSKIVPCWEDNIILFCIHKIIINYSGNWELFC